LRKINVPDPAPDLKLAQDPELALDPEQAPDPELALDPELASTPGLGLEIPHNTYKMVLNEKKNSIFHDL
jgi:hypothetical protein